MSKVGKVVLSKYEKQLLGGMKPVNEYEKNMIVKRIEDMLNGTVTRRYKDGTEVTGTALDQIISKAIGKMMESGTITDLMTLAKLLGQFKDAPTEVHVSKVDEDLEKRALE